MPTFSTTLPYISFAAKAACHVPMLVQRRLQQVSVWFDNSGYEVVLGMWHMTMNTPSTTQDDTLNVPHHGVRNNHHKLPLFGKSPLSNNVLQMNLVMKHLPLSDLNP
jgi:hypothetical protein